MSKPITYAAVNGITVIKYGCYAFYHVFDHTATLEIAYDQTGNNELPEDSELYKYFKNREKQLTRFYGPKYCPTHSRYAYAFCDVCKMK